MVIFLGKVLESWLLIYLNANKHVCKELTTVINELLPPRDVSGMAVNPRNILPQCTPEIYVKGRKWTNINETGKVEFAETLLGGPLWFHSGPSGAQLGPSGFSVAPNGAQWPLLVPS